MKLKDLYFQSRNINSETVTGGAVEYFSDSTDRACIVTTDSAQYVLFDGTSNLWEMLKNLLGFRGKKKHNGAYLSYTLTAEDFFDKMYSSLDFSKRVVINGVSRGGSIALIFTSLVSKRRGNDGLKLYTECMPPAGGKQFVQFCEELGFEHDRYLMKGDKITRTPIWGKHYDTYHDIIKNSIRGTIKKHLGIGIYLPNKDA